MKFEIEFEPRHGEAVQVSPLVRRITAGNPGPFTFHGTNTYLVGDRRLAVIDPGPDLPGHLEAVLAAIGKAEVAAIIVSHTHRDHSSLAAALAAHTGAPILGEGPHRPARALAIGEINPLDASADHGFVPDRVLGDGDTIAGDDFTLTAITTPGHCANHLVFALAEERTIFSADHVMGWSTSIVAPPDGAMADYMASLDKMIQRSEATYFPGHGGPIQNGPDFSRALKLHRLHRERAILDRVGAGDATIVAMVERIYASTPKALHGAAALSVLAHLEDLVARGAVLTDGAVAINGRYRAA
ncbi:MAG: MBL fold metallo-hydrolase [Hyphomicrobiaceae bacterium]|nr:MBL fold metallo-hydrolase [Hyphomicrobiaceae bacterium]